MNMNQDVLANKPLSNFELTEGQEDAIVAFLKTTCFAVTADLTSGSTAGDTASAHHTYSRFEVVNRSSRSAVASGDQFPPGNCAHTRIPPKLGHGTRRPPSGGRFT